jgi:uncharacterized membrane protein
MKKVKRILFVVYAIAALCFGAYILLEGFPERNVLDRIRTNPVILFPVIWTLFSLPSLFFNLEKLGESVKKSVIYRYTRIGDFLFLLVMTSFLIFASVSFTKYSLRENRVEMDIYEFLIPIAIILICMTLNILMLLDNLKFHKSFRDAAKEESIDDIGSTS